MTDETTPTPPPIPTKPTNVAVSTGKPDDAAKKAAKAERDRRYREKQKAEKAKPTKAPPKPKAKAKTKAKPKSERKPAKSRDARSLGKARPDTDAIVLGLLATKAKSAAELHESPKLAHLTRNGLNEAVKRLYAGKRIKEVEQTNTGKVGRPAWRYIATGK